MDLLEPFFNKTAAGEISQFHLYFDNYFTNLDLIVHSTKLGLKCTCTIRDNRVTEKNVIDKRDPRDEYVVKHEKNSGMKYITVVYSKPVSIVSTASGVTPLLPLKRYSSQARSKVEIPFPKAFHLYNKFMGGVDLHDGHCNNVLPSIRSKKWTWVVFMRLIQASIVNALVICNASVDGKNKVGTKEFAISIAKSYMRKDQVKRKTHTIAHQNKLKVRSHCPIRTGMFCKECKSPSVIRVSRRITKRIHISVRGKGTHSNQAPRRRQISTTSSSLSLGYSERRMSESCTETSETSKHRILMNLNRFRNFMSGILDPLYGILNIQFEIRNQRP